MAKPVAAKPIAAKPAAAKPTAKPVAAMVAATGPELAAEPRDNAWAGFRSGQAQPPRPVQPGEGRISEGKINNIR